MAKGGHSGLIDRLRKRRIHTGLIRIGMLALVVALVGVAPGASARQGTHEHQAHEHGVVNMPRVAQVERPSAEPRAELPRALVAMVHTLGEQFNGDVGIAVERVDNGARTAYQGNKLFPQQSVSKLWVAMTMLDAIDRGKLQLTTPVTIRTQDLTLFHQPLAAEIKQGEAYHTTLIDLFRRELMQSDNLANDSILRTVGGPDAVRAFLARRFIGDVRFGPGERLLQSRTAGLTWTQSMAQGRQFFAARERLPYSARVRALDAYLADPPDGAAPLAIVDALARLKRGKLLSPASTRLMLDTMAEARTGPQRIKGGVPEGWHYAHKTGTGQDLSPRSTGYNDVGIMTAPDGTSYAVAVMIGSTTVSIPERWKLMQAVSRGVAFLHRPAEEPFVRAASR